jgi:hypothetical protein
VTLRGTTFDKWEVRPDRPDNHLWDVAVLSCVAASVAGLQWSASGVPVPRPEPVPQKSWKDQQRQAFEEFQKKKLEGARR